MRARARSDAADRTADVERAGLVVTVDARDERVPVDAAEQRPRGDRADIDAAAARRARRRQASSSHRICSSRVTPRWTSVTATGRR